MRREVSCIISFVGGIVDLLSGSSILYQSSMVMNPMMSGSAILLGYSLLVLGVIVLFTGGLLFVSKAMHHFIGPLMILYGLAMLVLGVGMMGGIFNVMMQWSWLSGIVMLALGLAMLYSGSNMTRKLMT